jgi:hypothetical protein
MKKILICGDSYMALSNNKVLDRMHWSNHLGNCQVSNEAFAGASNTIIMIQLQNAIKKQKYDGIVLGFTFPWRLEFSETLTSCHNGQLTSSQKQLDVLWREQCWEKAEKDRNLAIAEYCVLLARQHAATVYSLNGLEIIAEKQAPHRLVDLLADQMPMGLIGHKEFAAKPVLGELHASFHVSDPAVHQKYAEQVINLLLKLA